MSLDRRGPANPIRLLVRSDDERSAVRAGRTLDDLVCPGLPKGGRMLVFPGGDRGGIGAKRGRTCPRADRRRSYRPSRRDRKRSLNRLCAAAVRREPHQRLGHSPGASGSVAHSATTIARQPDRRSIGTGRRAASMRGSIVRNRPRAIGPSGLLHASGRPAGPVILARAIEAAARVGHHALTDAREEEVTCTRGRRSGGSTGCAGRGRRHLAIRVDVRIGRHLAGRPSWTGGAATLYEDVSVTARGLGAVVLVGTGGVEEKEEGRQSNRES